MSTDLDFHVFDTTLRDGAQREGVSYSVADKLAVARLLDEIGVGFIEGGWPGALPKDTEFFARARTELTLRHAQLVAFGATRKAGVRVEDDPQVRALLDAETPVVCLVAKSDVRHVREALRTTMEENLALAVERIPALRPGNTAFDGLYEIPTFDEVAAYLATGIDGLLTDNPDLGVLAVAQHAAGG